MRSRFPMLAGLGALAASVVLMGVVGAAPAGAQTTPPWEPDPTNESGTISFYDASGNQITSGSTNTAPFAAYVVGNATIRAGDVQAGTFFFQPNPNVLPALWTGDQMTGFNLYPLTSGPANIQSLSQSHPVQVGVSTDLTLDQEISGLPNSDPSGPGCAYAATPAGCTNTGYQNLYSMRLRSANAAGSQTTTYDVADLLVNAATHTWTQVYPEPGSGPVTTTTSLSANPTTAAQGDQVMLTATVTGSGAAGSVEFFNGTTSLGKADVSGGTASLTTIALPVGADSLTATFTPTDATAFTSSTSPPVTVTITGNTPPPLGSGTETINVDVPQASDGTFTLSVDSTPVQMTTPTSNGSALDSTGSLSSVTVTDGRTVSKPGWNVSGQVSDFHSGSNTIDGNSLGWTPKIATPNSANDVTAGPKVAAGANPGLKQGSGLASAGAGKGLGQTTLGGDLDLQIPVDTPAGTYSATLTITAI